MKAFASSVGKGMGYVDHQQGMDLRDYFASHASESDIQNYQWQTTVHTGHLHIQTQVRTREEAKFAYADAMMKARK